MIRYEITDKKLLKEIRAIDADWPENAEQLTELAREAGEFTGKETWGKIKTVYMKLQHYKCAYCERKLDKMNIEHDVEHFRPKKAVKKWPTQKIRKSRVLTDYDFELGESWDEGYYLLAHNRLNYLMSCKHCNTSLKGNYFPIECARGPQTSEISDLAGEKALLLNPLGDKIDDPEDYIDFVGIVPKPKYKSGRKHRRGLVTIEFFDLANDHRFKDARAMVVVDLFDNLETRRAHKLKRVRNNAALKICRTLSGAESFTNCARSFEKAYKSERKKASEIAEALRMLLYSAYVPTRTR